LASSPPPCTHTRTTSGRAKDWCDRNTPEGYPKLISINAWNEWIEGSYLEPDEKYGMGYLEAVKHVFGSAGK
jgi:hypothetical protein